MRRNRMLIADSDKDFTDAFMRFIINSHSHQLGIAMVNDVDRFLDLKSAFYKSEILIISEDFLKMLYRIELGDMTQIVAIITEKKNIEHDKKADLSLPHFFYFKYANMNQLLSDILLDYSNLSENNVKRPYTAKKAKMIVLTSPSGGSGKSFLSVEITRRLSKKDQKSLLLSFEDVTSLHAFIKIPKEKTGGLSKIFLMMKNKIGNVQQRISQLIINDEVTGISYISPSETPGECNEITFDEVMEIGELFENEFDYIVIDGGIFQSIQLLAIAARAYKVLMILQSDPASLYKGNHVINYFTQKEQWNVIRDQLTIIFNKSKQLPKKWTHKEKELAVSEDCETEYDYQMEQLIKRIL